MLENKLSSAKHFEILNKTISLSDIKKRIKKNKRNISDKYKVETIGIFGSYVRGEATVNSDIDILVSFNDNSGITLFDLIEFEDYLTGLLRKKIDLVIESSIREELKPFILKEVQYI